jgi:bacillithiol system protein YtxJ
LNWQNLTSLSQLSELLEASRNTGKPIAIFKHSTRCSISAMAKQRLERDWDIPNEQLPAYYLDLLNYRDVSNEIAEQLGVKHESPQLLLVKDGKCLYDASHNSISVKEIKQHLF